MKTQNHWKMSSRIIWAITWKDITEALKNKTTLTVIISAIFVAAIYRGLPMLEASAETTRVFIYNPGESVISTLLENHESYAVRTYTTEEKMLDRLREEEIPALGLVIPESFDQSLEAGSPSVLQGYVLKWFSAKDVDKLRTTLETDLTNLAGMPIEVNTTGNEVYLKTESGGVGVQAAMGLVYILVIVGINLIPYLFMEEKQTRTIDALLVSPASNVEIAIGKALVGLFYSAVGSLVAFLINFNVVVHWWLAILTMICGAFFVVAIGLWLGMRVENRAQLSMWAWVFIIPLFFPIVIILMEDIMPDALVAVSRWVPSAAVFDAYRTSFAGSITIEKPLLLLGYLILWAAVVMLAVIWEFRHQEQKASTLETKPVDLASGLPPFIQTLKDLFKREQPVSTQGAIGHPTFTRTWEIKPRTSWQIIRVIAAKDIHDMIRNKLAISIIIGTSLLALPNALLPRLLRNVDKPLFVFYEPNPSQIVRTLAGRTEFRLQVTDSEEEIQEFATSAMGSVLVLKLPAHFDDRAGTSETINLDGYYAHWADLDEIRKIAVLIEDQLSQAGQMNINIQLEGHKLYPPTQPEGFPAMSVLIIIQVTIVMGLALVPLLMVEEKETHTFEAIIASPASINQVVAGKALAGLTYCLIASGVLMVLYNHFFVNWWVAILAALLTSAFAVALGLLVGMVSDSMATTGLWGGLFIAVMVASAIVRLFNTSNWPQWLGGLINWMPGSLMTDLYNLAMLRDLPLSLLFSSLFTLAAMCLGLYGLVAWQVNAWERR